MRKYEIAEIHHTIQGEGPFTGRPCLLVRFQGCNLSCSFCDTKYSIPKKTDSSVSWGLYALVDYIQERLQRQPSDFILLTGGEPLAQVDSQLMLGLSGLAPVHVETNGTKPLPALAECITVSPKGPPLHADTIFRANALKFLVMHWDDLAALDVLLRSYEWNSNLQVWLQPMSLDERATQLAYELCLQRGYNLSIQVHQLIGVK